MFLCRGEKLGEIARLVARCTGNSIRYELDHLYFPRFLARDSITRRLFMFSPKPIRKI